MITPELVAAEVAYRTERAHKLYQPKKSKAVADVDRPRRRLALFTRLHAHRASHA